MDKSHDNLIRIGVGITLGLLCFYLALRRIDFHEMLQAFKAADYRYLISTPAIIFVSHFLRALRWRYLLDPLRRLDLSNLFSSLIIGYAANTLMPAHLGEFLRAYVLARKGRISMSPVFATIVVERIIDVFSLLILMLLALFLYPFPDWIIQSAYIMLSGTILILGFLLFLKKATLPTMKCVGLILKPFPDALGQKAMGILETFVEGLLPMKRWHDYITLGSLSLIIWFCYGLVFYLCLYSFGFVELYDLDWTASLILLVVTTIAVVVPSSPGYVGTYHYLCQLALALFGIASGPALSFATVVHVIFFLPVLVLGVILGQHEGIAIMKLPGDRA